MEHENKEIELAIQRLCNENQIASKEVFGLLGTTTTGITTWFPDSLQRGYRDFLTPINERPKMLWNILGMVGYFSDGNFNYLPAYNQGSQIAQEVKTDVIAAQTWKLTQNSKEQEQKISDLEKTVEELKKKLSEPKS